MRFNIKISVHYIVGIIINFIISSYAIGANEFGEKVIAEANKLLSEYEISYAYGGSQIGSEKECEACNKCLDDNAAKPKSQLRTCPECGKCSLDCSHFIQLAFQRAGVHLPYLSTAEMLNTSRQKLFRSYSLVEVDMFDQKIQPGDLLVYEGHVVMVEKTHKDGYGDIIHATGGKDIREPGQGIQRERYVPLRRFRGSLLKVLRHKQLTNLRIPQKTSH